MKNAFEGKLGVAHSAGRYNALAKRVRWGRFPVFGRLPTFWRLVWQTGAGQASYMLSSLIFFLRSRLAKSSPTPFPFQVLHFLILLSCL